MHASDIAKIAASIAAGSITYEAARKMLGDHEGHMSILDNIIAGTASAAAGGVVSEIMDSTGVTDFIDDLF